MKSLVNRPGPRIKPDAPSTFAEPGCLTGHDLLAFAPSDPSHLPAWFETLTIDQLQSVFVAAIVEKHAAGDLSVRSLNDALVSIRDRWRREAQATSSSAVARRSPARSKCRRSNDSVSKYLMPLHALMLAYQERGERLGQAEIVRQLRISTTSVSVARRALVERGLAQREGGLKGRSVIYTALRTAAPSEAAA